MVIVSELGLTPGKSMRACEDVQELRFNAQGLFGDREYMWVETEPYTYKNHKPGQQVDTGRFLSQREDPVLTGFQPANVSGGLELRFRDEDRLFVPKIPDTNDGRIPVSVWGWNGEAVDQGDEAAKWGQEYLKRPVRLVALSDKRPRYVENNPELGRLGFADGFAVTVGSTAAIQTINSYLASSDRKPITASRMRTTINLEGLEVPDEDFPEDFVKTITIAQDGITMVLERWKACSRCPIPDTDPKSGARSRETRIRPALGKLGRAGTHSDTVKYGNERGLFLAQNFIIRMPEDMPEGATIIISRGSEVQVEYSSGTNWVKR